MNAQAKPRTREQEIELALEAMAWVLTTSGFPRPVRTAVARAHTELLTHRKQCARRARSDA